MKYWLELIKKNFKTQKLNKVKKVIFILASLMLISQFANSQTYFKGTDYKAISSTTFCVQSTDTGTDTLNLDLVSTQLDKLTIQFACTKQSGTAAGTARLYGSNWGSTGTWEPVGDTLTLTNQTLNKKTWTIDFRTSTVPIYRKYRILRDGATTLSALTGASVTAIKK